MPMLCTDLLCGRYMLNNMKRVACWQALTACSCLRCLVSQRPTRKCVADPPMTEVAAQLEVWNLVGGCRTRPATWAGLTLMAGHITRWLHGFRVNVLGGAPGLPPAPG